MALLQLIGQSAFIVASLVIGGRLLLLWSRTREVPELSIALSFLLGGGLGYISWITLAIAASQGASAPVLGWVTRFGLATTCLGAIANGVGIALIFRPGARWTIPFLGTLALFMAGAFAAAAAASSPESASSAFWAGLLSILPIYAWAAGEALGMARTLHRRARIGLADPIVVNRIAQWGVSGAVVVLMTSLSFVSRLLHGPILPAWVSALNAAMGLVAAAAIWFGFFPPRAIRERLAAVYRS